MYKVNEKAINELQQNVDKFVDKMTSDDFKVDKEQSVKFSKFFESFLNIISKNENLLPEKAKKVFNNIFLNLDKMENKKISDNTIEELKTYLKKHDYESIGNLLEKDISFLIKHIDTLKEAILKYSIFGITNYLINATTNWTIIRYKKLQCTM